MKKFFALLLSLCLLIPQTVYAVEATDEADVTGPVIGSVSMISNQDVYQGGDEVAVNIEAADPSGISWAQAMWMLKGTEKTFYTSETTVYSGGVKVSFSVSNQMSSGTWVLSSVWVSDVKDNITSQDVSGIEITVDNSTYKSPKVNSLSVSPTEGASGDTVFVFTAEIEQGTSEMDMISVELSGSGSSFQSISLTLSDTPGVYQGSSDFKDSLVSKLTFHGMTIVTKDGEWHYFTKDGSQVNGVDTQIVDADFTIILTDVVEDTDLPELIDFSFKESTVYTPGTVTINVTVRDKTTAVEEIEIVKVDSDTGEKSILNNSWSSIGKTPDVIETLTFSEDYSRYTLSQSYYIESIKLTDACGNQSFYSIDNGMAKRTVNIVNNNVSDVFLSLSDPDLCEKVAGLKEGTIAVVDTSGTTLVPEELFYTIKGKNITIIFEQLYYSNLDELNTDPTGVQWIINGKDIEARNIKPINVGVRIQRAYIPSPWLVYQETKHEKPMPRFQMDYFELMDVYVKEKLIEDGYEDVIPQIYSLQKKGEYFSETYMRLVSEIEYIEMVFADNGVLPAKSTIRLKPSYALRWILNTEDVFLHFVNPVTDRFELVQSGIYRDSEGYYEFVIRHNSTYALDNGVEEISDVTTDVATGSTDTDTNTTIRAEGAAKTGDVNNISAFTVLILISGIVIILAASCKKRKL